MRGTEFQHLRRMCDGRQTRTTRLRTVAEGPSRGKDGGWAAVMVGASINGGEMLWINRLTGGWTEQSRVLTESMRHRNGNFR